MTAFSTEVAALAAENLTPAQFATAVTALANASTPVPVTTTLQHVDPIIPGAGLVRVDPVASGPGAPGTVTMPATGHVLSLPLPTEIAMPGGFIGYATRVSRQCGGHPDSVGALFIMGGNLGNVKDPTQWPLMADKFFDIYASEQPTGAYLDKAKMAAAEAAMTAYGASLAGTGAVPAASLSPTDAAYLYATLHTSDGWRAVLSGSWLDICRAMQLGESSPSVDPSAYAGPLAVAAYAAAHP